MLVLNHLSYPYFIGKEAGTGRLKLTLDFSGGPVVKTLNFHCRGVQVWSLIRELRSHMQHRVTK